MSISVKHKPAKAVDLWFHDQKLCVRLEDGREIFVPLEWFPRLKNANAKELKAWRFISDGIGIHWEDLDEDLSIDGLLQGDVLRS